jgi:hypothetical protein
MLQDCSAETAADVADATTYDRSENIRHGTYQFLIRRVRCTPIKTQNGFHKYGFWELTTLESKPNPQSEGDHVDFPNVLGPLKDDGTKPNTVGSNCALKADFDGTAAIMARANIQDAILAFYNKRSGEASKDELAEAWIDLCRLVPLKVGEYDMATKQPATRAKPANPACGVVINCTTMTIKKKTPNDKGAFVTKLIWSCAAPLGTGINSAEHIAKRRAEIEATAFDDEAEDAATPTAPTPAATAPAAPTPSVPPPPPAVPVVAFKPAAPWVKHPDPAAQAQGWFWSDPALGGNNAVRNEQQIRNGQ